MKKLREEAKLSQAELADWMAIVGFDWTKYTVQRLEAGRRRFTLGELLGIAWLFRQNVIGLLMPEGDLTSIAVGNLGYLRDRFLLDFFVSPQTSEEPIGSDRTFSLSPPPRLDLKATLPKVQRALKELKEEQDGER
jgi:transcriptional regulator with XRE-family HTH domain